MILDKTEIKPTNAMSVSKGSELHKMMSGLAIGQSFVIGGEDMAACSNARSQIQYLARKLGIKVKTRAVEKGSQSIRVWRVV